MHRPPTHPAAGRTPPGKSNGQAAPVGYALNMAAPGDSQDGEFERY